MTADFSFVCEKPFVSSPIRAFALYFFLACLLVACLAYVS
jgi:hypothetical protein